MTYNRNNPNLFKTLKNQSASMKQRLEALGKLSEYDDDAEALLLISSTCTEATLMVANASAKIVSKFSQAQVRSTMDFALMHPNTGPTGRQAFRALHKLRRLELLEYLLELSAKKEEGEQFLKTISTWAKDLGLVNDYIKMMLSLPTPENGPTKLVLSIVTLIGKIDRNFVSDLVKQLLGQGREVTLRGIRILEKITTGHDSAGLLLRILRHTQDSVIRSNVAKVTTKMSGDLSPIRKAITKSPPDLQADLLAALWQLDDEALSEEIKKIVAPFLESSESKLVVRAARVFHSVGARKGLDILLDLLNSSDEDDRAESALMLGDMGYTKAIDKLLKMVRHDISPRVVESAMHALSKMDLTALHVENLLTQLEDSLIDPNRQKDEDYESIKEVVMPLLEPLKKQGKLELAEVTAQIREIFPEYGNILDHLDWGTDEELKALTQLIASALFRDAQIRSKAALLIGNLCGDKWIFRHFLNDDDSRVLANSIEALEHHSESFATSLLNRYLEHPDRRISTNAAKALHLRGSAKGLQSIVMNLKDNDPLVRISAVWALGEIGNVEAKKQLKLLKRESDENVKNI